MEDPRLVESSSSVTPSVFPALLHANLDVTACDECSRRNLSEVFECDEVMLVVGQKRLIETIKETTNEVQNIQIEHHPLPKLYSLSFELKMPDCRCSMDSPIAYRG